MRADWRSAIARVSMKGQTGEADWGTGFLVAPGYLITAWHVVDGWRESQGSMSEEFKLTLDFHNCSCSGTLVRWDPDHDWALIACPQAPKVSPLPLGRPSGDGAQWHTWGFPRLNASDGKTFSGKVQNVRARYKKFSALELCSPEASGTPVGGLSGAPCLEGDHVVGLMCWDLEDPDTTYVMGGSLYATHLDSIFSRCKDILPLAPEDDSADMATGAESDLDKLVAICEVASRDLLQWPRTLPGDVWLERAEQKQLLAALSRDSSTTLILGSPGTGKSALLAWLGVWLQQERIPLLAIKSDLLPADLVTSQEGLSRYLELPDVAGLCVARLAGRGPVVLLIDQLDALAELVDLRSRRLNILLNLIKELSGKYRVHIVASCRTFEHRHDARLRSLKPDIVELSLPEWSSIAKVLEGRGIPSASWHPDAREVLRTPQHLDIFLSLAPGDRPPESFTSYQLMLHRLWETRVSEGGVGTASFLSRAARLIAEREEFWLPTALFDDHLQLLEDAVRLGLMVRDPNGVRVAFRHQTLFDHARARAFVQSTGALSNYVLERQDALFVRPQLWSALHYLRACDRRSYHNELGRLWNDATLRRHLRVLLVEFLGLIADPDAEEATWLLPWLERPDQRGRVLRAMVGSPGWFERIMDIGVHTWMRDPSCTPDAVWLLRGALPFAAEEVLQVVTQSWLSRPDLDAYTLKVIAAQKDWNEQWLNVAVKVVGRTDFKTWAVHELLANVAISCPESCLKVLAATLLSHLLVVRKQVAEPIGQLKMEDSEIEAHEERTSSVRLKSLDPVLSYYWRDLSVLATAVPKAFVEHIWPWLEQALEYVLEGISPYDLAYRQLYELDDYLDPESGAGKAQANKIVHELRHAMGTLASRQPREFVNTMQPWMDCDAMLCQRIIAQALLEVAPIDPKGVLKWLLDDRRRLSLGDSLNRHSCSYALIKAVSPYLADQELASLQAYIAGWDCFDGGLGDTKEQRRSARQYLRWAQLTLQLALPIERLPLEMQRHIAAERRQLCQDTSEPAPPRRRLTFTQPKSPVRIEQMRKMSDKDLLAIFKRWTDEKRWPHPEAIHGGTSGDVSVYLSALAKEDPARIERLARQLQPGSNENAAGKAVEGLSASGTPAGQVYELILALCRRGFTSMYFRLSVCRAAEQLLDRDNDVPPEFFEMMQGWLCDAPERDRAEGEAGEGESRFEEGRSVFEGGMHILPAGNFPILRVLLRIAYSREGAVGWITLLESHLRRKESPQVWQALQFGFNPLVEVEHERAEAFLNQLFDSYPSARDSLHGAILLRHLSTWASSENMKAWLRSLRDSSWRHGAQGFGELLLNQVAQFPDREWATEALKVLLKERTTDSKLTAMCAGLAHSAERLWANPRHRELATEVLLGLCDFQEEQVQAALGHAIWRLNLMPADCYVELVLETLRERPALLIRAASLGGFSWFSRLEALTQDHPKLVTDLCNVFLDAAEVEVASTQHRIHFEAGPLVSIALTLQRLEDHRKEGIALYERLLEIGLSDAFSALAELDRRGPQSKPA